jgi:transcriptional regulator with XRE-family HTH domain
MRSTVGISLLEQERRRRGLSNADLAEQMAVSHSSISQVERGLQRPSDSFKRKAAAVLDVSVEELWPTYFLVVESTLRGVGIRGVDGRLVAYTDQETAERAAAATGGLVCGADAGLIATLLGVVEAEVPDHVRVDPSPSETGDGAAPARKRAVDTSEGLGTARHDRE